MKGLGLQKNDAERFRKRAQKLINPNFGKLNAARVRASQKKNDGKLTEAEKKQKAKEHLEAQIRYGPKGVNFDI